MESSISIQSKSAMLLEKYCLIKHFCKKQRGKAIMQNKCSYIISLTSSKKLIKENSIPPWRAGPLARVHMENIHLTKVGSCQNQVRFQLGGLAHFSYEHNIFWLEFLKKGAISPRWASPPNRVSSLAYEQVLNFSLLSSATFTCTYFFT